MNGTPLLLTTSQPCPATVMGTAAARAEPGPVPATTTMPFPREAPQPFDPVPPCLLPLLDAAKATRAKAVLPMAAVPPMVAALTVVALATTIRTTATTLEAALTAMLLEATTPRAATTIVATTTTAMTMQAAATARGPTTPTALAVDRAVATNKGSLLAKVKGKERVFV